MVLHKWCFIFCKFRSLYNLEVVSTKCVIATIISTGDCDSTWDTLMGAQSINYYCSDISLLHYCSCSLSCQAFEANTDGLLHRHFINPINQLLCCLAKATVIDFDRHSIQRLKFNCISSLALSLSLFSHHADRPLYSVLCSFRS